jgi:putative transposase
LKLRFFLPSSLATLSVAAVRSAGFCRPHVSDENPFSESQFKTLKYLPEFPERFGSIQDARGYCQRFFPWYNTEHHHAASACSRRKCSITAGRGSHQPTPSCPQPGFERNPERFVRAHPRPPERPTAVRINPPSARAAT